MNSMVQKESNSYLLTLRKSKAIWSDNCMVIPQLIKRSILSVPFFSKKPLTVLKPKNNMYKVTPIAIGISEILPMLNRMAAPNEKNK